MSKWQRAFYQTNKPLYEGEDRVTSSKQHINLSKDAAKEGMVLLKNEGKVLPLSRGSRVAFLGKGCIDYVKGGGGSGDVTVSYTRNLYEGIKELGDYLYLEESLIEFYKDNVTQIGRAHV